MLRIKPLLVLCAALLTVTPAASADVNSDMNQFFNKLGFASNTTQPGVWQGQAAGYAYGGSLYARTQVKNIQLISMTLPDINAGCGGIDAYLGSFSFINGDQLQRFVKQIMRHCCKVSDEAAFCLIQRPYISKTLLTRRISPRGSP